MKKSLIYLITLLACIVLVDRVLAYVIDTIFDHSDFRYVNLFHEAPDIYVIGNSRAVYAVCESKFDKTYDLDVLNLAFTRLNSESIEYLSGFVDKKKLLMIEVSPFLSADVDETGTISPIFSSVKGLRPKNSSDQNMAERFFKCYNFNNRASLRLAYHLLKSDKDWVQNRQINASIIERLDNKPLHELHLKKQFYSFQRKLEQENYNYVFFHGPYHPAYRFKIKNLPEIHQELKNLLGNKFIDITDLLDEDQYFADGIHTNYRANEIIHKKVAQVAKNR